MLFKISDGLFKNVELQENGLTFPKSHIPPLERERKYRDRIVYFKWGWVFWLIIGLTFISMMGLLYCLRLAKEQKVLREMDKIKSVEVTGCVLKHRRGSCMPQGYNCCEGEYAISVGMCAQNQVCCIGSVQKCKGTDIKKKGLEKNWSFESLTRISSKIMFRNVSESVVEQAIVTSVSAIEERQYYHEMSDKIGTDMTALTGLKWFSIVGNKNSFDLSLGQFSAYILIEINELEVLLIRAEMNASPLQTSDYSSFELNEQNIEIQSDLSSDEEHDYDLDTGPTFDIIRNEMNESMKEFSIQTIDFLVNSCLNNYKCFAPKMVAALNQRYKSTGIGEWQTIITSNTVAEQMVVDVDYSHGFLLDGIFNSRHRILIYRAALNTKLTEVELIKSGRKALAFNKTIVYENGFAFKVNVSTTPIIEDIRRSVMANNKLQSICGDLTSLSIKHMQSWGCVAGPQHSFAYSFRSELSKHYLVVKLNQLVVILFQKPCSRGFRM